MTYKPTPLEIAEYFRDEVARFADTNIPGQTIFTIECNCNPHSGGLPIKFTVWNNSVGETVAAGNMADAITEFERRYITQQRLAPLMIERHVALEDSPPASVAPPATDDEIPF